MVLTLVTQYCIPFTNIIILLCAIIGGGVGAFTAWSRNRQRRNWPALIALIGIFSAAIVVLRHYEEADAGIWQYNAFSTLMLSFIFTIIFWDALLWVKKNRADA